MTRSSARHAGARGAALVAPVLVLLVVAGLLCAGVPGSGAAGVAAPASPPAASSESSSTAAGAIAFTRLMGVTEQDGDFVVQTDIFTVRADGTGLTRLTDTGDCSYPAWSPDGTRIAFIRQQGLLGGAVWVMAADGTGQQLVTQAAFAMGPGLAWAPGEEIVFSNVEGDDVVDLLAVGVDGGGLRNVTPAGARPTIDTHPVWAPDGRVFFARTTSDKVPGRICAVAADGSGPATIRRAGQPVFFSLSPSGRSLLLWSRADKALLRAPARAGAKATVLLKVARYIPKAFAVATCWSPDGARIAFASGFVGQQAPLYTADSDGTHVKKVQGTSPAFDPAWRPE